MAGQHEARFGILTQPDGTRYEGEFESNKRQGQGTYKRLNVNKYVGQWESNMMRVLGVYTKPNVCKYEGRYVNGKRHVEGVTKNPKVKLRYIFC